MRTALACLLAGVCMVSLVRAADDDGEKVVSKKGGLSAVFPQKPTLKEQKDGEQYILEEKEKGAYLLQFNNFEKEIDSEDAALAKKILDATQDGLLKAFPGSKVVVSKDVKDADTPTRVLELDLGENGGYYNAVLMLDDEKLYHIAVLGKKDFAKSKGAAAFLESLELEDD